jgi:hypothetical protein
MAYSLNTDVIDEFKNIDTTNGRITTAKIDEWIDQADAYINGRIGLVYSTPVTATESLKVLKEISVGLVAQRISRVLETKSITPKGDQYIPKDLIEKAEKRLDMIVNRQLILSDATKSTSHGGVRSYSQDNTVCRKFDQTKAQW